MLLIVFLQASNFHMWCTMSGRSIDHLEAMSPAKWMFVMIVLSLNQKFSFSLLQILYVVLHTRDIERITPSRISLWVIFLVYYFNFLATHTLHFLCMHEFLKFTVFRWSKSVHCTSTDFMLHLPNNNHHFVYHYPFVSFAVVFALWRFWC